MKILYSLMISLFACLCLSVSYSLADTSISNSKLRDLRLLILPGETSSIVNSEICLKDEGEPCIIAVKTGGKLKLSNTEIGNRVTIYGEQPGMSWLKLTNSEFTGSVIAGLPPEAATMNGKDDSNEEIIQTRSFSNNKLDNINLVIKRGESTKIVNSDLCLKRKGQNCTIFLEPGSRLEASNSKFGERLSIEHGDPFITNLNLANCEFYGPSHYTKTSTETEDEQIEEQDAQIPTANVQLANELQESGIEATAEVKGVVINLPDVFFEFNRSNLTSEAQANVSKIIDILSGHPNYSVALSGHTDSVGGEEYNQKLSESRASSVSAYLRKNGMSSERIIAVQGFGKSRPVASNDSDEGRAKNRRVEILASPSGSIPQQNRTTASSTNSATKRLNSSAQAQIKQQRRSISSYSKSSDKQNIRLGKKGLHLNSPEGEVHLDENGLHVGSPEGEIDLDGSLHVDTPDGTIEIGE